MASTNKTPNLGLDQWLPTDKPNWDIDLNADLKNIDDFAGDVRSKEQETDGKINTANATIDAMQTEVTKLQDQQNVTEERVADLEADYAGVVGTTTKLSGDVTTMQGQLSELETNTLPQLNQKVDGMEAQVNLNTSNINTLTPKVDALAGLSDKVDDLETLPDKVNALQGDIGAWGETYPDKTVTEKVIELDNGGGSSSSTIKIVEATWYLKDTQNRGITIPSYNGEEVILLGGRIATNGYRVIVNGHDWGNGAVLPLQPAINVAPFKEAFNNPDTNVTFDGTTPPTSIATFYNQNTNQTIDSDGFVSVSTDKRAWSNGTGSYFKYNSATGSFVGVGNAFSPTNYGNTTNGIQRDSSQSFTAYVLLMLVPSNTNISAVVQSIASNDIDLSDYYTKEETDQLIATLKEKVDEISTLDARITKNHDDIQEIYTQGMTHRMMKLKDTSIYGVGLCFLRANTAINKLVDTTSTTIVMVPLGMDDPTQWLYVNKDLNRAEKTVTVNGGSRTFVLQIENDTTITMMCNESGGQTINQYPVLIGVI